MGKNTEAGDKYLGIVILEDNETVHNAFPDRDFNKRYEYENRIF